MEHNVNNFPKYNNRAINITYYNKNYNLMQLFNLIFSLNCEARDMPGIFFFFYCVYFV